MNAAQDSGAIGRLNERQTVDALLACLPMHEDGTGHIADCGYDWEVTAPCACASLPSRFADLVREHTDRALAEVEQRIERIDYVAELEHGDNGDWMRDEVLTVVRAARQEQGHG